MTEAFEAIIEQKKASVLKVMEGLQELVGQPVLQVPPDKDLQECTSPELVYLIALDQQVKALEIHAKVIVDSLFNVDSRWQTIKEVLNGLGKLDDSKGGASFGW